MMGLMTTFLLFDPKKEETKGLFGFENHSKLNSQNSIPIPQNTNSYLNSLFFLQTYPTMCLA